MRYCTNCGKQNDDSGKFCESCGAPFEPVAAPQNTANNVD
ncbi:MAG: zinc-ribbon domain-containing protein, partial [Clostridiales bacterium]|nr:zinc-ribbon domain-containing protein [Clostridiales bacterium]